MAKVATRLGLAGTDQAELLAIARAPRQFAKGEFITHEGSMTTALVFLCSGTAYAARTLEDGSQQIVAVFLPGDLLNPGDLVLRSARASIYVSASAVVLEVPHAELLPLLATRPAIIRALWCETALHAAIQREWLIWLGRRSAQARLAHFLCEVSYRMQHWSGSSQETVAFPFTQRELADALGLSYVHVNRVLQHLRSTKLIELVQGRLTIRSREFYAIAEFDPGYLQTATLADPLPGMSSRFAGSDIRTPHGPEADLRN
ncbi:Crp/Fnr family transcriptional regulator [Rhodopseudomonas palustris]|nr:Crp/Fnr family transcriptional regulator [Rhodopseudomonas palustris]